MVFHEPSVPLLRGSGGVPSAHMGAGFGLGDLADCTTPFWCGPGQSVSSVVHSQSLRSDARHSFCLILKRPCPRQTPAPGPTRASHCGLLLPSLSSAWVQCLFPAKREVGKDTRRSSFLLLCQQFRDEGLAPACAGQCAVSSMVFFRSSRCSSQSSSGS